MHCSFVIPLFNCLPLTQAMLASLEATLPSAAGFTSEIIFVDDGSTDGTREWLRTLPAPRFRVLFNEKNLGYAAANNRGAATATGDLLILLNNDLVLSRGWLEPLLALARPETRVGVVGNVQLNAKTGAIDHAGIFINAKGKPAHLRALPHGWARTREVAAVTGACLLVSRPRWNELGGFDEGFFNGGEDVDFCLRARRRGWTSVVALRSVIRHHVSSSPGRKRRDEANTRKLVLRWKNELTQLGARAWCEEFAAHKLNFSDASSQPLITAQIFAHALGWTKRPPASAILGLQLAIDREIARWDQVLPAE